MDTPKRKVKINLMDLENAFEFQSDVLEITYFLDQETGEVVMTTSEDRYLLENIYKQYADEETGKVDWPKILPLLDIPDWQREPLFKADLAESDDESRFIPIPQEESHEGYNDMVAFIETVSNRKLRDKLEQAITGKGAFRRFKDVLSIFPNERDLWFKFQQEQQHQRVLDWLESEGIEPI